MAKAPQYYMIRVERMTTSPGADCVASWSGVIAAEDVGQFKLSDAVAVTDSTMEGCPIKGLRPMTVKEIEAWRGRDANG